MIIGFTASSFDMLHAGHVAMLEEANAHCDFLVCALHVDPSNERPTKSSPRQPLSERYIQISAIKWVDKVVPYETEQELVCLIGLIKPNIRFVGEEYRGLDFTGKDLCKSLGIKIHYNSRAHGLSSTLQRRRASQQEQNHA